MSERYNHESIPNPPDMEAARERTKEARWNQAFEVVLLNVAGQLPHDFMVTEYGKLVEPCEETEARIYIGGKLENEK